MPYVMTNALGNNRLSYYRINWFSPLDVKVSNWQKKSPSCQGSSSLCQGYFYPIPPYWYRLDFQARVISLLPLTAALLLFLLQRRPSTAKGQQCCLGAVVDLELLIDVTQAIGNRLFR